MRKRLAAWRRTYFLACVSCALALGSLSHSGGFVVSKPQAVSVLLPLSSSCARSARKPLAGKTGLLRAVQADGVADRAISIPLPGRRVLLISMVQFGLALVGLWLSASRSIPSPGGVVHSCDFSLFAIWLGLLGSAPLIALAAMLEMLRRRLGETTCVGRAVHQLFKVCGQLVLVLMGSRTRFAAAMFCAAALGGTAGLWEEIVFRGMMQSALIAGLPATCPSACGVAAAAVVFGLLHAVTPLYFVLATAAGTYLGHLFISTGNLLVPIVAHAVYDFVALLAAHLVVTSMPITRQREFLQ